MVTLDIDEQTLDVWRKQANAEGVSVEKWLRTMTVERPPAKGDADANMTAQEWHCRLTALANRHPPTGVPMDDSRESIYE